MTTSKLLLPELSVSQASKEITHNQALAILDQVTQARVLDKDLTAPPGSPANGAAYIVATSATGAWAGKDGKIAYWLSSVSAWSFANPLNGWLVYVDDENKHYRLESGVWVELATGGGGGGVSLAQVVAYAGTAKTLGLSDINTIVDCTSSSAVTITIAEQASVTWTADAEIHVRQSGTGAVSIAVGTGVTIPPLSAPVGLGGQGAIVTLKRRSSDVWFVAGVTVPQQLGVPYATAGGTANAITLTTNYAPAKQTSLVAGHQVRARISTTNTGATTMALDGLTAKNCVTVTGVALPAGYIRTDVDTLFTYDAVNDRYTVGRELERGSNASGTFWRSADGAMRCENPSMGAIDVNAAAGSLYISTTPATWTFPAAFLTGTVPVLSGSGTALGRWVSFGNQTNTSTDIRAYAPVQSATTQSVSPEANGKWY